ncbi:52 kDa repressor of the inhibitor of the protein kinase-like [Dendronephthya gigantea]|uniref:52 kDa repressor of the inhibitor of the protein kinase-like n=1 Tax=Dendronephthya gigantea TaxID=151771 RepID=UPI00106D9BA4|nr:52 kDa repressor of the inhibitor of the protein kinase-like [Dendronephthya gigantea]
MKEFGLTRNKLAKPSTTRWVERITSLDGFLDAFEVIYETLNFMQSGGSQEEPFLRSASDAQSHFRNVEKFEFMAALVITQHVLDHTLSLTVQLQKKKIDIAESIKQINLLKDEMAKLRASVDSFHNEYYDKLLALANNLDVAECFPRVCKAQTKHDNHPTSTACDYYRLTVTIPLIDHVIAEIEYRFPSEMCNLYNGFYILPRNFLHCKGINWKTEFMKFVSAYRDDMPNFRAIHAELELWETSWKKGHEKVEYDNIADTLRNCNELAFPNIFVSLKILAVIPVTTCEFERSVSALRRMKTWLRSTMTNERLNGLALMHINDDLGVNVDEVINSFARQNPTRMQFLDIFDDNEEKHT